MGYVKRNAIAGLDFYNFAALEQHLARWCTEADQRIHGTTHERPAERFARDEKAALRPLPMRPMPVREQRITRRVANDCFVDVETVRYSVPHELVKRTVEVVVGEDEVVVFHGRAEVARHRRCREPYTRMVDPKHFEGIFREREQAFVAASSPIARSLDVYAACLTGAP